MMATLLLIGQQTYPLYGKYLMTVRGSSCCTYGENTDTLTTTAGDAGKSFRCKVTYQDDDGAASVVYTNVITLAA